MKSRQVLETDFILPKALMSIVVAYYGTENEPELELEQERYKTTAFILIKYSMIYSIAEIRKNYRMNSDRFLPSLVMESVGGVLLTILGASLATIAVPAAALVDHYYPKPKIESNQKKMQQYKEKTNLFKPFRHHNVDKHLMTEEKATLSKF